MCGNLKSRLLMCQALREPQILVEMEDCNWRELQRAENVLAKQVCGCFNQPASHVSGPCQGISLCNGGTGSTADNSAAKAPLSQS